MVATESDGVTKNLQYKRNYDNHAKISSEKGNVI